MRLLLHRVATFVPARAAAVPRPAFRTLRTSFFASGSERPERKDEYVAQRAKDRLGDVANDARETARDVHSGYRDLADGVKDELRASAETFFSSAPPSANATGVAEKISDVTPESVKRASRAATEKLERATDRYEQGSETVKERARHASSEVRESLSEAAGNAKDQIRAAAGNAKDKAQKFAKHVGGSLNEAERSARDVTEDAKYYAKRVGASLNESLDAAEDKFSAPFSPNEGSSRRRPNSPIPSEDLRAAQVREEANMNDLVDELEDKVRNLDHVKDAVRRDREADRGAFADSEARASS